jgi:ABC-type nitrate/sulfonate/bicarbonate transport system ATPase subunit
MALIQLSFGQTSALDAHTESELMRNINNILLDKARTSIFIAHRLRTVVEAGKYPFMFGVFLAPVAEDCFQRYHNSNERRASRREGHSRRAPSTRWLVLHNVAAAIGNG